MATAGGLSVEKAVALVLEGKETDLLALAKRAKVKPSQILERLPLHSIPGIQDLSERPRDRVAAYLQLMSLRAVDVLFTALEDDQTLNEKVKVEIAKDILNRNSYQGVKRVAVAQRITLASEVMERLCAVEAALRTASQAVIPDSLHPNRGAVSALTEGE